MKINCSIVHKCGLPDYSSLSVGLSMEYEVPDNEDPRDRIKGLYECVETQVKQEMIIAKTALAGNGRTPDKAGGAPLQRPVPKPPQNTVATPPPQTSGGTAAWRDVVTPIPKKCAGWTLGQVEEHEPSSLKWLQDKYEPKTWTDRDGNTRQPSKKDIDLRQALNDSMTIGGLINPPEPQQSQLVPESAFPGEMAERAIDEAYVADQQGGDASVPF